MKATIRVSTPIVPSARTMQVQGIFDVPPAAASQLAWEVDLPIEAEPWNVGLIVGPSGSGKSTIARHFWPEEIKKDYQWPSSSILDGFPPHLGAKEIVALLSSVGFSSPPSWLRPFSVLSLGEQFRATMARAMSESKLAVIDEFTSMVDRTVAQIGSHAISRTIRARGQQFIAVTCHSDVEEWLQPDWVYRPGVGFTRRAVQRRPPIELEIRRIERSAWRQFRQHHYLSADLNPAAWCFGAYWRGVLVAFSAWLPFFGKLKGTQLGRRAHRSVCLPDYQGAGIGNALTDCVASHWAGAGFRVFSSTGHPAQIQTRNRSKNWRMTRAPTRSAQGGHKLDNSRATDRLAASFEWVGPKATGLIG